MFIILIEFSELVIVAPPNTNAMFYCLVESTFLDFGQFYNPYNAPAFFNETSSDDIVGQETEQLK